MSEKPVIPHLSVLVMTHMKNALDIYLSALSPLLKPKEVAKQELHVPHINKVSNVNSIQVIQGVSGIQPE